jgi:hypothetical protein
VPFDVLHRYTGAGATMQVRLLGLFGITDERGPEMDVSETVTMFNDLCVFAPAWLAGPDLAWEEIDAHTVRGTFTNAGHAVSAVLTFADSGALVDFVSDDRWQISGELRQRTQWSTPIQDYGEYGGLRLPRAAEARWALPGGGSYAYGRFVLLDLAVDP